MEENLRTTPLLPCYEESGAKTAPFAGYVLPMQFAAGVLAEHQAVRENAGIFDVSHMGELLLEGPGAFASLQELLTNDFTTLAVGGCRYAILCKDDGCALDDLLVYRLGEERYWLIVNGANREKDYEWIRTHLGPDTKLTDESDSYAQIALQGPKSVEILKKLTEDELPEKYYTFRENVKVAGAPCLVSRTGYTGEDGFELYIPAEHATHIWRKLLEAGKEEGLLPCGLAARDTLRLEAAMPLYGHELTEELTPLDAGLKFAVKLKKASFIGLEALKQQVPEVERVGLVVTGRGVLREHQDVYLGEEKLGQTTSGTFAPHLGKSIAMAYVRRGSVEAGQALEVDVRGRRVAVEVVPLPFYKRA